MLTTETAHEYTITVPADTDRRRYIRRRKDPAHDELFRRHQT